jgi:hypothetical protein
MIVDEHGSENAIGVIDGPAHAKQGKKTPGVQRQYCGESGMMDNCVVGQHLIYANNDPTNPFSGCIASDVYLPECWVNDPALMRWPGHIPAGKGCDAPLMTIDMLPTIARLIGGRLPDHKIDGLDISDVILGKSVNSPHAVLWFDYGSNNLEALRSGKWKLELPRRDSSLNGRPGGRGGIPAKYEMLTIAFPSKVACGEPPLAIRLDSQYLGCG